MIEQTLKHAYLLFDATETRWFRLSASSQLRNAVLDLFETAFDTKIASCRLSSVKRNKSQNVPRRPTAEELAKYDTLDVVAENGAKMWISTVSLHMNFDPSSVDDVFDLVFAVWALLPTTVSFGVECIGFLLQDRHGERATRANPGNPARALGAWGGYKRAMQEPAVTDCHVATFMCSRPQEQSEVPRLQELAAMRKTAREATDYPPWVRRREEDGLIGFLWANTTDIRQLHEVFTVQRYWMLDKLGPWGPVGTFIDNGDERIDRKGHPSDTSELTFYHSDERFGWVNATPGKGKPIDPRLVGQAAGWIESGRTTSGKEIRLLGFVFPTREEAVAGWPQCSEIGARAVYQRGFHLFDPFPDLEFIPDDWRPDPQILGWEQTDDGWVRVPGVRSPVE